MPNTFICPACGENKAMEITDGICRCPVCRTTFKRGDEECLASCFRSLTFDLKKLGQERIRIMLSSQKNEDVRTFKVFTENSAPAGGVLSPGEWENIARTLFCTAHFECWRQRIYDPSVSDGMMWTLTVLFERKHSLSCHGCNGYPPYWNDVISSLSFCFDAIGLNADDYKSKRKEPS